VCGRDNVAVFCLSVDIIKITTNYFRLGINVLYSDITTSQFQNNIYNSLWILIYNHNILFLDTYLFNMRLIIILYKIRKK